MAFPWSAGDVLNAADLNDGFDDASRRQVIVYESSGTFSKATYPWARYVHVRVVGGGGAGGGAATTSAGEGAEGGGGGAAGYTEKLIAVENLAATETVTVGAGGTAVSGADGGNGSSSSFGSFCTSNGGSGGTAGTGNAGYARVVPGEGGSATGGDINIPGADGHYGIWQGIDTTNQNYGGESMLSSRQRPSNSNGRNGTQPGGYGGGGGGGANRATQGSTRAGGDGAPGIVIVEIIGGLDA
jgi:hypothetical protein